MKTLLTVLCAVALAGCGVDSMSAAATAAATKKAEIEQGKKNMERAQQNIGQAMEQAKQSAERAAGSADK